MQEKYELQTSIFKSFLFASILGAISATLAAQHERIWVVFGVASGILLGTGIFGIIELKKEGKNGKQK